MTTHLYRGSQVVQKWSRHKKIDHYWTLCGIHSKELMATENSEEVTCSFCRMLMEEKK